MGQSPSSAGDVAGKVKEFLTKEYGEDVSFVDGEDDVIGLTDENDVPIFVKVELA